MLTLTLKIWLLRLQYEIQYFTFNSLKSHLRLIKENIILYSYTSSISNQYCIPSPNMIQSHPTCYSGVRAIAFVIGSVISM